MSDTTQAPQLTHDHIHALLGIGNPSMSPEQTARFEAWARRQGYNTTKEGNRYCQGVVNALHDAWIEALKGQP